jgi:hypothetical protein
MTIVFYLLMAGKATVDPQVGDELHCPVLCHNIIGLSLRSVGRGREVELGVDR